MRLLFGILLALSILLFVALQWGGALTAAGKINQASGEMNPEKIILLDKPVSNTDAVKQPEPVSAPVVSQPHPAASAVAPAPVVNNISPQPIHEAQPAKPVAAPAPKTKEVQAKPVEKLCVSWGEFSGTDLVRTEKILATMNLGSRLSRHEVEYESGYWVYIPPLKNKAAITRTIKELKAAGIEEYFVLKDAKKYHNAISLGIFKSEESATHLQALIRKKGFHHVQVAERKGKLKYVVFDIRDLSEAENSMLANIHKDFPGSDMKKSSCPAG